MSTLSLLLALLMILSISIAGIPTASAKGEAPFVDCEEIFIDMSEFTGWAADGAAFKVFTFYNDSNDEHYCHEYAGNFNNDNWYDGSNVLAAGISAVKFYDNVYSFRIPANNLSHLRIVRTNGSYTQKWNLSPFMWNNSRSTYTVGGKKYSTQNCIKIKGWDNNAVWSTFTPTNKASYSEVTAVPDSSITGDSNLYTIDATFYDYYTDDEVQNGWGKIRYSTNHSKNTTGAYWEPYQYLNSKIASASSGINYPLYFGNFFDKEDDYKGEGSSNMVHFSNWVNNSSRLGGNKKSVVGLTGPNLVNGDLYYAANGGVNSSTKVPLFDKTWLENNKVGSVVNTKFPMRKEVSNGVTTYAFNSEGATSKSAGDSVWFNSAHNTISYGTGNANGAKDALEYYSAPKEDSGYGFFPFDSTRGSSVEANNFGFGMRVDVKFNLGADDSSHIGQIKGANGSYVNQKFSFTGDDDVWVYVDGKLILDLGGDHKKADGTIDFHNRSVNVTTGTNTLNDATRNQSFTLDNYGDPTAEHTLTMFYVERGMVESNLSFDFNFAPIGNELIVDKTVNTASINNGLKTAVAAADTFTFNQPTANGKVSSKGTISNSKYTLKNGESISFKDQFTVPTRMTVTETESSPLDYTTSWKAVDLVLKGKGQTESQYMIAQSNSDSKDASFDYKTKDTSSEFAMTRVQLSYENTPKVAPVTITKRVSGLNTGETDNTDFDGTVEVSLDGTTWKAYPLQYTIGSSGSPYTLTNAGKLAAGAKLRNGRTLTFAGIPQGAKVRFKEDTPDVEHSFVSVTGGTTGITVGSANAMVVTNQKNRPGEISVTLEAKKILTGATLTTGAFNFELLNSSKSVIQTKSCASDGSVKFDAIKYTAAANDTYYIREKLPATADPDVTFDQSEYRVTVNVTKSGLTLTPTVTYYKNNVKVNSAEFTNTVKPGEVYIVKEDNAGNNVTGVKFAIYKVSSNGESLEGKSPFKSADTSSMFVPYSDGTSKLKTAVHFTDLPLYENNTYKSTNKAYQWYAIAETDPATGYFKNKTVTYFQLPVAGSYSPKYEYVNGHILSPESGFGGMFGYKMLGIYAICFAALLGAAYVLYTKRNRKKAHHRAEK